MIKPLMNQFLIAFLVLFFLSGLTAQSQTGTSITRQAILDNLEKQTENINDYSVTVKLSIKMPKLRMPRKKITLYFKASRKDGEEDKIKIKSRGFAVVPKMGLTTSPFKLFDNMFEISTPVLTTIDNQPHWIITGKMKADSLQFNVWKNEQEQELDIKLEIFVDPNLWVITRINTLIDSSSIMSINTDYKEFDSQYYLPVLTVIEFNLDDDFLEKFENNRPRMSPMENNTAEKNMSDIEKISAGMIRMEYSKYKINIGIDDNFFKEEKPSE